MLLEIMNATQTIEWSVIIRPLIHAAIFFSLAIWILKDRGSYKIDKPTLIVAGFCILGGLFSTYLVLQWAYLFFFTGYAI